MLVRCLVIAAAVAVAVLPMDASAIERWYANGVYPRVQNVLTPLSNLFPVAWLDVITLAAVAWLSWFWWRALRRLGMPVWRRAAQAAATTITVAAAVYLVFAALWGLNYRRVPLAERLVVREAAPSTLQVLTLGREVIARLNDAHRPAHEAGWHEPAWRNASLRTAFADVQRLLAMDSPAVPGRLKQTLFGPFFRWTAVDGMVNPFGLEVLSNPDLLPFEQPFVAAHEWAHLAGYADEAEANFIGWLTTVRADAGSRYSGWLYLYWQISGELPQAERQLLAEALQDGPRADVAAIVARLRRGDLPALRRATWMVYDSYLKANRVEEGVRSYGAVVTLILRAQFDDGWRPVLRPSP